MIDRSTPKHGFVGYLVALILVTGVFIAANTELLRGDGFPRWDASKFYAPAYMLVADHAREGRLLLWNPWMNGGRPDGADPQVGSFSPWTVAMGLVTGGKPFGYIVYWLTTWWLGILGVILLARHLRAPPWGAVIAASAFFSCGYFTGHAQHMSFIYSMALLPWLVWRVDVALMERRTWPALQAGAIWGVSALAGYPGMTILNFGFAGLWTIGRIFFAASEANDTSWVDRLKRSCVVWLWILAIGVAVLSPTYASFFVEGKGYSDRVEALSRKRAVESNALHPGAVTSLVSGHLGAIKGANRELWKYSDTSMVSVYTGAIALFLALGVPLIAPRRFWYWWLFGVGIFFLLSAIGQALPLRGWLFDYLPPMRYFRHPAIFRGPFMFVIAVLVLFCSRELEQRTSSKGPWIKTAVLGLIFIPISWSILSGLLASELVPRPLQLEDARRLALLLGAIPALAAAIAFAPWSMARRVAPWILAVAALVDAWSAVELSKSTMIVQNRIEREIWAQVEEAHVQDLDLTSTGLERSGQTRFGETVSNRGQAAKEAFFQSIDPFSNRYMVYWSGSDLLKSWVTTEDRIWFSSEAHPIAMSWDVFRAFVAIGDKNGAPPLLIHPPELAAPEIPKDERKPYLRKLSQEFAALPTAERGLTVETVTHRVDELVLQVMAPSDGWLWVTDRYTAGWSAEVNGRAQEVVKANFLFRAVRVTEGFNKVRFSYEFAFYPYLLWISWGTLLVVLVGSLRRRPLS